MSTPFDGFLQHAFDITTNVMGYDAVWTPSLGGEQKTGRVHYREPSEKDLMTSGITYMPFVFIMEYKVTVFTGLLESVQQGNIEIVVINGASHRVRSVFKTADGQTFEAYLDKITD